MVDSLPLSSLSYYISVEGPNCIRPMVSIQNPTTIIHPTLQTFFFKSSGSSNATRFKDAYKNTWLPFLTSTENGDMRFRENPQSWIVKLPDVICNIRPCGFGYAITAAFYDEIKNIDIIKKILDNYRFGRTDPMEENLYIALTLIIQIENLIYYYFTNLFQLQISITLKSGFWSRTRYKNHPIMEAFKRVVFMNEIALVPFGETRSMEINPEYKSKLKQATIDQPIYALVPRTSYEIPNVVDDLSYTAINKFDTEQDFIRHNIKWAPDIDPNLSTFMSNPNDVRNKYSFDVIDRKINPFHLYIHSQYSFLQAATAYVEVVVDPAKNYNKKTPSPSPPKTKKRARSKSKSKDRATIPDSKISKPTPRRSARLRERDKKTIKR